MKDESHDLSTAALVARDSERSSGYSSARILRPEPPLHRDDGNDSMNSERKQATIWYGTGLVDSSVPMPFFSRSVRRRETPIREDSVTI